MSGIPGQPGPKPSSLAPANPTEAAQAAADKFFANDKPAVLPQVASGGGSPEQQAADQFFGGGDQQPQEQPGMMMQGLGYAARGLDYAGGLTRTGLASVASVGEHAMKGELGDDVTPTDVSNALKGKAPNSAEYLRRLGVGEGGSMNVPLLGRVTMRGAAGLATDIATDPLVAIARAVKTSPYLSKLFNAPGAASEALGEAVYKSALPDAAKEAGDAIIEGAPGVAGAPIVGKAGMAEHIQQMSDTMGKLRQGLYDRATQLGATVDVAEHPLERAQAVLQRMERDPQLAPVAEEFGQMIDKYQKAGAVPLDIISEWKTNLYDVLPDSGWAEGGKFKGAAKQFKAALAGDFREAIVNTGNKAEKGLGDSIEALNSKWGTLLSATKPIEKATQATGGKLGHMIDGAVLAAGGVKGAVVKKGFDFATSPYAKTLVGKALMSAGRNGVATGLANRTLIDTMQGPDQKPPEPEE